MEDNKIQELQILDQKLQNSLLQKQAFQIELAETDSALEEIEKSGDEVFKIIGQLMIKTDKEKIKDELSEKKKILELRIKSLDKQEKTFTEQVEKLRDQLTK